MRNDDTLKIALDTAEERLAAVPEPYVTLFERGEARVLLFAPKGVDDQSPHTQDELYIVQSGRGRFRRGDEVVPFGPGDLLFVPAHTPHRFEDFSDDFETWVVFFGPKTPKPGG